MKTLITRLSIVALVLSFVCPNTILATEKESPKTTTETSQTEKKQFEKNKAETKKVKKLTFKQKLKLIKQLRKERRKARKMGVKEDVPMVVLYILAVLLPPVAVGLYTDWGEPTLWNLLFTLLFWLPGIVHAFYILLS